MGRVVAVAAVLAVAVLAATACRSGNGGAEMIVAYQRVGGFAGFDDRLVVNSDGMLVLTGRAVGSREKRVNSAELAELRRLLGSADFARAPATYDAPRGADQITHTISSKHPEKTVVVIDGASPPRVIEELIAELQRLWGLASG
jgi:hypothetical protein